MGFLYLNNLQTTASVSIPYQQKKDKHSASFLALESIACSIN